MPYKSLEKRRACARESQRRRRARLAHPLRKFKAYVSPRYPFLDLGPGLRFENGFLITDLPEAQILIEANPEFGRSIFPLALDFSSIPTDDE